MGCKVAPAFWAVITIGTLAVVLHTVGFSTPGWVILSRKFTVEEVKLTTNEVIRQAFLIEEIDTDSSSEDDRQLIDEGGLPHEPENEDMPMDDDDHHHRPGPPGRHHGRRHHGGGHHGPHHEELMEETTEVQEWIKESVVAIEEVYVKLKIGLWHAKFCMSAKMENLETEDDSDMDQKHDSSSSSSSEDRHHKKCHCKRISTKCALAMSPMFLDGQEISEIEAKEHRPWYDYKKFLGNTCLTEHRVLATIGLALLVIAVLAGFMAFRKQTACRCWAVTCLVCLLVAFVMISVPVFRIWRYNYHEVKEKMTSSHMRMPFSGMASLLSLPMILILAIVVAIAICRQRKFAGQWKRFENDADTVSEKKSGMPPSLVFVPEALNGKPGFEGTWGDLKPVEFVEPEKKPLE